MRRVAVVGSSDFPLTPELGRQIVDVLRSLGTDVVLLTRGRGMVDEFVVRAAPLLGLLCVLYPSDGGAANWQRDIDLVTDADEVVAIFSSRSLPDLSTGTAHLVERSLDKKKPVRAYAESGDRLVYAGALP